MTYELERDLTRAFRRAELPLAPDRLRQVLLELPASVAAPGSTNPRVVALPRARSRRLPLSFMGLAAAFAVFAVVAAGLYFGGNWLSGIGPGQTQRPSPTADASPTAAPSSTAGAALPSPAQMLADHPDAEVVFQRSVGPADKSISDDARIEQIDLGPVEIAQEALLGAACLGPGELTIEARWINVPGAEDQFPALVRPCDGEPTVISYHPDFADSSLEVRSVIVPAGASWRVVIGALPEPSEAPATFGPITGTDGWWRLWDVEQDAVDPSTGIGAAVRVADDVTRLGVWVECTAGAEVTVEVAHDPPSPATDLSAPFLCSGDGARRYEVIVAAGEEVNVKATPTTPVAMRLYIEADAMPVSRWGDAPALPADVANAPFMASSGNLVALGRVGGERQTLIPIAGLGPFNTPGGDYAALAANFADGATLHLASIDSGESLAVLAQHDPGMFIAETWVDPVHEQVFYTTFTPATETVQAYRVGIDGADHRLLASAPASEASVQAWLSLDLATFLVDSCAGRECHRVAVDAETLESRELDFALDSEVCDGAGVTDGIVVLRVAKSCAASPPEELVVVDMDGKVVLRVTDPGTVHLVRTVSGPVLLTRGLTEEGMQVLDLQTGSSAPLAVDAAYAPVPGVALPPDWVLLAPFFGIGDFPIHPMLLLDQPSLLVNVVSGESIELTNLPH